MYFIEINSKKEGPFTFEQVVEKDISRSTLVWKQGLTDWVRADELPELNEVVFSMTPPEFPVNQKKEIATTAKSFSTVLLIGIGIAVLAALIYYGYEYNEFSARNNELDKLGLLDKSESYIDKPIRDEPPYRFERGMGPLDKFDQGLTQYMDRKHLRENNFKSEMKNILPKVIFFTFLVFVSAFYAIKGITWIQKNSE